ncbi:hypothetical protein CLOM_g13741 [Closterium sp. NIES-68]|nr:hypothetical protein CLOM_g13741 [Closterium sp. NIES-68]
MNERGGDANGRGAVAEKASEPPPSKVEALDGSNYEEWSGRMRSAFKRYKLLKIALGEEKMPEEGEARERWIEKSAVLFDLILQSVNKEMFEHIKDLVEADDSGPRAWKLLRDVIQPNTLPMVIVLEKELAAISMRPGDDVKPVLDKIKDTYARMAAAGSSVSQLQHCTKIISGDVGYVGKVVMHPLTHWVIDSGCTSHMTPRADLLDEVKPPGKIKYVAAASGALLPVIGVGNAKVKGANGELVGLGNVLLVKGLSANLLSVRRLQKSKAEVTFGPTSCRAKLGRRYCGLPIIPWNGKTPTVAAAKATAGGDATAPTDGVLEAFKKEQQTHGEVLASVDASAAWAKASSRSGEADWETWHERLCHVNFPMLQKLVKDGSLKGLEVKGGVKEIGSCPTCLETKFSKFPFNSTTGPAKTPLALVHMDVVGPTRALSLSGSRYFLTIVDDHTRVVWVYPLKSKGEVAAAVLKEWMPRAQRECGHKVKVIHNDNGGEFIGADFEGELKRKGIQHQLTVPYNPQQNGVAKRFNRTLQEGARTLLGRAGLPDPFWVSALRQVALVKNRALATVGEKEWIPYTKWYGSALAVNMLRAFGCMVVFHVPKEKRGKLEASGRWGVHLGIAKDHKGWLLWDLTTQKLTVSRDVKFLESLYYKEWKQQQQKLPSTPLIVEADEVQRPPRQVEVAVSEEEMSGVTEEGGAAEVEQQQQQHESPPRVPHPPERPRRDVRPPVRLTYGGRSKPNVVQAGSVVEQIEEDEIAHCYWAPILEPKTREEALNGPNGEKWKASEDEEFGSLIENETWDLCDLPPRKKAITSKMIYRHKYGPEGELTRYKSRLVARGFQQTKGKDYDEVFAPVGKGTTLRVLLAIAALLGWKIRQMDIVTAFLNGIILEEVYMKQPEGLDDGSGRVCRLKKAIYGLKQAPRAWYHKLEEALLAGSFKKSECDPSLFLLQEKDEILMLLVYVDDILLFSASTALLDSAEQMLEMQFKCSKMGEVKYYLGMHVERDVEKGVLRLQQRKYCEGLAEKYGLQDGGKPATPLPSGFTVEPCADEEVVGDSDRKLFHSMVGSLNYAANHTRPDIAFATSRLASVVSRPSHEQLEAAKRLVRYVSATASVGLEYSGVRQRLQRGAADVKSGEMLLSCYTDASFNSVKADGTSIRGYVCLLGGGAVSWRSKKQNEVGLSSCETEYMALHHGAKEVVWLRRLLEELGVGQEEPTVVFCDNESAVKLAKNACLHGLTKHIRPKWHWVRRLLDKEVRLEIVKTHQQAADIFTKRLAEADHWKGMKLAGMSVH